MESDLHHNVKKVLANKHACYIVITCDEPGDGEEMSVQMSYEGDAFLASYLLQGAQSIVDNDLESQNEETAPQLSIVEKRSKKGK